MTQLRRFIDKHRVGVPTSLSTSDNAIEIAIVQCVVRIVSIVLENMNAATLSTQHQQQQQQQQWTADDIAGMATELAKWRITVRRRAIQARKTLHDNVSRITEIVCSNLGINPAIPTSTFPPPQSNSSVAAAAALSTNPCLDAMSCAK